jgi:hypothetical protein
MVNGTPVLSPIILLVTNEEGVFVGNGPSVSEGVVVQLPDEVVPDVVPDPDVVEVVPVLCLVQELSNGKTTVKPKSVAPPFFIKSFLCMVYVLSNVV